MTTVDSVAPLGEATTETATSPFRIITCALHHNDQPSEVLPDLVAAVAAEVPWADAVALIQAPTGRPRVLAATADPARQLDELQFAIGEGPLLDAVATGGRVRSDDLFGDLRWPRLRVDCRLAGMRSAWATQLCRGTDTVLSLYARDRDAMGPRGDMLAAEVAEHVHSVVEHYQSADRAANLATALSTSRQIGAAMGVLMAMRKVPEEAAFDLLRTASQQLHRKLRDIAVEVLETGSLPTASRAAGTT